MIVRSFLFFKRNIPERGNQQTFQIIIKNQSQYSQICGNVMFSILKHTTCMKKKLKLIEHMS